MARNLFKMLAFGTGGMLFAGLFGVSLASYAESGSFEFYKRHQPAPWSVAQTAPYAEPAGYPMSPPSAPVVSPVEMIAAPRVVYSAGYPGDGWRDGGSAGRTEAAIYERISPGDASDARVIPGAGGSWTEPVEEVRHEAEEANVNATATRDSADGAVNWGE